METDKHAIVRIVDDVEFDFWNEKGGSSGEVASKLTTKVTEFRFEKVVLALGTAAWIMHANDSHMFRLSESPTNIIFFPLHLAKKSAPLNLHRK